MNLSPAVVQLSRASCATAQQAHATHQPVTGLGTCCWSWCARLRARMMRDLSITGSPIYTRGRAFQYTADPMLY